MVEDGAAMKKNYGSSMDASQDKSASMDDYSHEKKLKADGRYEAAHGEMAKANNDFDHAHALKKDAAHDAKGRHSIMRHMKGFGASMKIDNMGASLPGTPAGSKSKRSSMTNLGTQAMAVKNSVAGQSLQTDTDNFVTKSEYPFVRPGDRVDGLKKFQSGGNKGLPIDNDYSLETKSNNKAPYNRPPSKFAGDYKVFQAVEKTNVSKPTEMKAMKTGKKLSSVKKVEGKFTRTMEPVKRAMKTGVKNTPAKKAMKTGVKK